MRLSRMLLSAAAFTTLFVAHAELPNWTVTWTNETQTAGTATNDQNGLVLRVYRTTAHNGFGLGVGISGQSVFGAGVVAANGPAYLDMHGTITGPDPRVDPATNALWKFSHLSSYCFRPNDGPNATNSTVPAAYMTGLHTPGTLASDGWRDVFHIDGGPNPYRVRELIVDEPDYTGNIGSWGLNGLGDQLTNLVYRVPKATTLIDPASHMANKWTADVGRKWDFSSITKIGNLTATATVSWGPFSSGFSGMTGILRLPSLVHVAAGPTDNGAAFRGCNIGEVELGLTGNLTRIATYSFKDCDKLTNIVIGASPAGQTLTICTNAFRCGAIKTVYFDGEKPTFDGAASAVAFGTGSTPEGQITFYVRDTPSWAAVLAEAEANGGFVSGTTFRTANRQKVARYSGFRKVAVELQDPRFAARYHETVTLTASDGREGDYHYGEITLAATCSEPDDAATDPRRAKFLRWDGVPVELERVNPLTYTPVKDGTVRAVFAHDWLMSDDAEPNRVMENGFWRLSCWKRTDGDRWVGLGKAYNQIGKGAMWPAPERRMGGGDLNLNGDIWDSLGNKWTLASVAGMAIWPNADGITFPKTPELQTSGDLNLMPTRLTLPETLKWWPGEIQNYDSWDNVTDYPHWPIEEVIVICPEATGMISQFTIGGCCYLKRLVIRAPKVTGFGNTAQWGFAWTGSGMSGSNFDDWDLSGVTNVSDNAFHGATDYLIPGTLRLPNVMTVGMNAFVRLTKVTGLVLGTNGLSLTSIDDAAFKGTTSLKTLTLGTRRLTLGSTLGAASVFTGAPALTEVHFPGPVLPAEQVDAILQAVQEKSGAKQTTIYASPMQFWGRLAAGLTAEESAVKPSNCFGVYRAGARKAWLVVERSPFETKGSMVILR
ncbi:MAG TPA: leucine-rich repeat protein [Kiritimatiellia bacterium]|nr:leucine-rich repeat protein [Kiritimatiellia bacterium]